jgi:hypothetical protein
MEYQRAETADRLKTAEGRGGGSRLAEARADLKAGRARPAAPHFARAIAAGLPPAEAREAHIALGDIAVNEKDDASAARHYAAAIAIAPDAGLSARLSKARERLDDATAHAPAAQPPTPAAPAAPK